MQVRTSPNFTHKLITAMLTLITWELYFLVHRLAQCLVIFKKHLPGISNIKICYHRPRQQKLRTLLPLYETMICLYPELLCAILHLKKLGVQQDWLEK